MIQRKTNLKQKTKLIQIILYELKLFQMNSLNPLQSMCITISVEPQVPIITVAKKNLS